MQRLGLKKKKKKRKRKRKCTRCVICFSHWTVLVGWTENGPYTGEYGWLRADLQRSQTVTKKISSLILICDAKTRFLRKKKKGNIVNCFGHWNVFIHWTESGLCKRDGWLRADPQRSQIVTQLISPSVLI